MTQPSPDADSERAELRRGTAYGIAAYGIWGIFPLYFHALKPSGAWEILAHRIVWTLVFCALVLTIRRDWRWLRTTLRSPRLIGGLSIAALVIAINWVVYIIAVVSGRTYEAALGYFLNPIVTVGLGVFVLGERLRRLQWAAVTVGAVAAVYLAVAGGVIPWIPLVLAISFATYGLVKKRVGASLAAMHSLTAETMVLVPVAAATLIWVQASGENTLGGHGTTHTVMLLAAGVITAIPLLFFAAAARRVPLVTIGLLQFMTPILQLLCGVLLLGEHVSPALWIGFGIVWIALALLTFDSMQHSRHNRARTDLIDPEP
ncbi:MAG TPA: EamA family transporter RarD [Phycicoccus sp.]|nr:EamA family transporter RarD [Phycicoccus sp.]